MKPQKLNYSTIRFHGECVLFDGKAYTNLTPSKNRDITVYEAGAEYIFKKAHKDTNTMHCTRVPVTSIQSISYFEDINETLPETNVRVAK